MTTCPEVETVLAWLEGGGGPSLGGAEAASLGGAEAAPPNPPIGDLAAHVEACPRCADLARDLRDLRARVAGLSPGSWAGAPPVAVDVEAALRRVLRARRPSAGRRVLQLVSTAAALLVAVTAAAPGLLRRRVDTPPSAPTPRGAAFAVFFTTTGSQGDM